MSNKGQVPPLHLIQKFVVWILPWAPAPLARKLERLQSSGTANRIAKGTFWSVAGNVVSRLAGFFTALILTRVLGTEKYGQVGLVQSTVEMFSVFGGLGLSFTATKYVAELRSTDPARAGRIVAMTTFLSWGSGATIALICALLAPWLARETLAAPEMTALIAIGAVSLFFSSINSGQVGTLSGLEAFKRRAWITSISALCSLPLIATGAFLAGPVGAVTGLVINSALLCLLTRFAVAKELTKSGILVTWKRWREEIGLVFRFGIPTMLSSLVIGPASWVGNTLLAREPGGFAELGRYNAAGQWARLIMFLPALMSVVSMAVYADLIGRKKWDELGRLVRGSIQANALLIVPVLLLSAASPWLMRTYGAEFAKDPLTLVLQLFTAFMIGLYTPIWPMLLAAGRAKVMFATSLIYAVVLIGSSFFLVRFGARGLSAAGLISSVSQFAIMSTLALTTIQQGRRAACGP